MEIGISVWKMVILRTQKNVDDPSNRRTTAPPEVWSDMGYKYA